MTAFDDPILDTEFTGKTWSRGQRYYAAGRVRALNTVDGLAWKAQVSGSQDEPYDVWLKLVEGGRRAELLGGCTCPVAIRCKHLAAVLEAVRDAAARIDPATLPSGRAARIKQDLVALRRWKNDIESKEAVPTERNSSRSTKKLVFIVEARSLVAGGRAELHVQTHSAFSRKDGALGATQRYDMRQSNGDYGRVPAYVSEADRVLWFRLTKIAARSGPRNAHEPTFERSESGTALFREFVETGRCHLANSDGPVLSMGPAVDGAIRWRLGDDGRHRARIELATAGEGQRTPELSGVLPLWPPHYVEARTGLTGPISLDLPDERAQAMLDFPPLDPETIAALPPDVESLIDTLGIDLPASRPVRWLEDATGRARLSLFIDASRAAGDDGFANTRARLVFEYGPLSVRFDGASHYDATTVTGVVGEEVLKASRDHVAEERWLSELKVEGLEPRIGAGEVEFAPAGDVDWPTFYEKSVPRLRERGWNVDVGEIFAAGFVGDDAWYVDAESNPEADWFSLEVGVEVDGRRVNLLPAVVDAIRSGRLERDRIRVEQTSIRLPLDDQRWVVVPRERLAQILDTLVELYDGKLQDGRLKLARSQSARVLGFEGVSWSGDPQLQILADRLARREPLPVVEPPEGLQTELREYQQRGLDWLGFLQSYGFGGVLADDMGLGKTVQFLAHILAEREAGRLQQPCLVVAPRSVIHNWANESERFAPSLRAAVYHGPNRHELFDEELPDLLITTYALLQRDDVLRSTEWAIVALDEAQAIKNPNTQAANAARELRAKQRLCLTGTPMENNLGELWSLFAFVAPGLLGTSRNFGQAYRKPIERDENVGRMRALSARIAPFMLRRTKAQVLSDLPPKSEVLLTVPFEPNQRDLYESVRMTMEKRVRKALHERGLAKSHIVVLDALLKLRQVCCHPELVKTEAARRSEAQSAKTERLLELLGELHAEGRSTIVFSQFTSMLAIVARELDELGIAHKSITGKTRKRQEVVDSFQAGEFSVLLISLKAGGTGINLTRADTVIHYDPWWNPAVEDQATDRAHRIGQEQPVTVYKLVCEGTVEQRVLQLQDRKRALTEALSRGAEERSSGGLQLADDDVDLLLAPVRG